MTTGGGEFGRQAREAQVNLRAYAVMVAILLGVSIHVNLEVTASMKAIAGAVGRVHAAAPAPEAADPASGGTTEGPPALPFGTK